MSDPNDSDAPGNRPASIRQLLTGGDRRSLARSAEALARASESNRCLAELAQLVGDPDWLVVMRAIDALEKLAHQDPHRLQRHRNVFIGSLAEHESWEIRLQIARALPLFEWSADEHKRAKAILLGYLEDPAVFVRAWALDSLATLAEADPSLRHAVKRALARFDRSGKAALMSRARRIRSRPCKFLHDKTHENR